MKIHIVQKGDTLWNISKKYGVSFDELKAANTQLSNPDMIMPGMKIKVPTGNTQVKKETQVAGLKEKEMQVKVSPAKEQVKHPYADITPPPLPVTKEKEQVAGVEDVVPQAPYIPKMPKLPHLDVDFDFTQYKMNFPQPPTNVLPGMMEPDQISPVEDELPEAPVPPVQQPYCVPVSPVMPGYGFNYCPPPFVPGQFGPVTAGFGPGAGQLGSVPGGFAPGAGQFAPAPAGFAPGMPHFGALPGVQGNQRVEAQPIMDDDIDLPPQMPQMPQIPQVPQMPQMPQMQEQMAPIGAVPQFPVNPNFCYPITPVMPGYGFNGYPGQPMAPAPGFFPGAPMQGANPQVSPWVDEDADELLQPNVGGFPPYGMPAAPYANNDCGCGGPQVPPHLAGYPMPQGYAPFPAMQAPPMMQPNFGYPAPQGFPPGLQGAPFAGMNPAGQMPFNPMFTMPDFDDNDFDD